MCGCCGASGPVRKYCTKFAGVSSSVAASSLGHVAGPHLPRCVLATNDDPPATSAQNLRTDPLVVGPRARRGEERVLGGAPRAGAEAKRRHGAAERIAGALAG